MKRDEDFGFYAILTNPVRGYAYSTECIIDAGIRYLQLRIKDKPRDYILQTADIIRKLTSGSATRFILNDHPDIAFECGADGVHVGQNDMPYHEVRAIMDDHASIGISTHTPEQTATACALSPDYIGVGPVYPTPTKKIADPAIGITGLKEMLAVASVPAVAIGGIDCSNLSKILDAGARNFCMVRQLTCSDNPQQTLRDILHTYREYYPL